MKNDIYKWVALALFLVLLGTGLFIYRPVENRLTRVTVVGDSEAKIAPDTAVLTFSVVNQGTEAVAAQQENARRSEAVKKAVEALANETKVEVKTSNYSLSPEYSYDSSVPKIKGYEVKNSVQVSISSMDRVGDFVDAATKAGANSVDGIQFVVGQASPAQGEALALAAKQAMAKAEAVAASMNGRIVRVVQSTEGGVDPAHVEASYLGLANASANVAMKSSVRTPIMSGPLDVRSQVVLVVDIAM